MSSKMETEHLQRMVGDVAKVIELEERRRIQRERDEEIIIKNFDDMLAFINSGSDLSKGSRARIQFKPSIATKAEKIISLASDESKLLFRKYKDLLFWAIRRVPEERDLIELLSEKYFAWWLIAYGEVYNVAEMVRITFELAEAGMNPMMAEAVARLLRNPAVEQLFNDQRKKLESLNKLKPSGSTPQLPRVAEIG